MKISVFRFLFRCGVLAAMLASVEGTSQAKADEGISDADRAVLSRLVKLLSEESRSERDHERVHVNVDSDRDRREREERTERDRREREEDRRRQQEETDRRRHNPLGFGSRSLSDDDSSTGVGELNAGTRAFYPVETPSPELFDEAFGRYVSLNLVVVAIRSGDASSITDIALQLAEGERILFRTHKSGVTSRSLLEKATKLALDFNNTETLDRLQRIFEKIDDKELISQLATSRKLGSESRSIEPELALSFDAVTFEEFRSVKETLNSIREAELLGDRSQLQQIESAINASTDISEARKDALIKRVKAKLESMPTLPASTYGKIDPISRLMGSSRGWGIGNLTDGSIDPFNKNNDLGGSIHTPFKMPGRQQNTPARFTDPVFQSRNQFVTRGGIVYTHIGNRQWTARLPGDPNIWPLREDERNNNFIFLVSPTASLVPVKLLQNNTEQLINVGPNMQQWRFGDNGHWAQ